MVNHQSFLPINCKPNASLRLRCFPYAEGSALIYANWGKFLSDDIEIIAAQPPGRSMRLGEDAHTKMTEIIDDFMDILIPLLNADFKIAQTYQSEKIVINCPMTILGGTEDTDIPVEKLNAWGDLSIFPANVSVITGDHFFINTNTVAVINEVSNVGDTVLKHLNQRRNTA